MVTNKRERLGQFTIAGPLCVDRKALTAREKLE